MDRLNKFGKDYRGVSRNSDYNTRRYAENFPYIERKVDIVDYQYPFYFEFKLSDHPHTVYLDLQIKEPEAFRCAQAIPNTSEYSCVATDYSYNYSIDYMFTYTYIGGVFTQVSVNVGDARPVIYGSFTSNIGGWELNETGGIIVPKEGYYNVKFETGSSFIVTDPLSAAVASVRKNGVIVNQVIYSVTNGKLTDGYNSLSISMWGLCIFARPGDVLGGFMTHAGLYGASFTSGSTTIAMIGTG